MRNGNVLRVLRQWHAKMCTPLTIASETRSDKMARSISFIDSNMKINCTLNRINFAFARNKTPLAISSLQLWLHKVCPVCCWFGFWLPVIDFKSLEIRCI